FEQWRDTLNYSEPVDWYTNVKQYISLGATVYRTDDAFSGDSAAVVQTVYSQGPDEYYGGYLTNGKDPDSLGTDGWQINYRPQKLTGYYKYAPAAGDSARVILYMYQHNQALNTDSLVATGNI